jgi:hypothetical protein
MSSHPPVSPDPARSSPAQNAAPEPLPTVAVIAIHGVGQHAPGSSAEAMSTLLNSLGREDRRPDTQPHERPYTGFVINSIDVPVRPVLTEDIKQKERADTGESQPGKPTAANDRYQNSWWAKFWGVFDERRGFLAAQRKSDKDDHAQSRIAQQVHPLVDQKYDYQFMLTQLADYKGEPGRNFSTVRFESQRRPDARKPHVHIYDAHYSDLSKQENSIVSFFFAFYQLLFHLGSLSLLAVYWAEADNTTPPAPDSWWWRFHSSLHATSIRLLTMFVPLLNLIVLFIGFSGFADKLGGSAPAVGLALAGLLSLAVFILWLRRINSPRRPLLWALVPASFALLGMGSLALLSHVPSLCLTSATRLVLLCWLILAGAVVFLISRQYAAMRPGADWVGGILYVINAGFFIAYFVWRAAGKSAPAATTALASVRFMFGELTVCWVLCLVTAFFAWIVSLKCIAGAKKNSKHQCRARSAFRTGRFAFAIPASLFLVVTIAIWSGVIEYGSSKLHLFDYVSKPATPAAGNSCPSPGLRGWIMPDACQLDSWVTKASIREGSTKDRFPTSASSSGANAAATNGQGPWDNYLRGLLLISVTPGLPVTLTLIGISFFLLVWAVLPSIFYESSAPVAEDATFDETRAAGNWLSRGIDNTAILIRLLWVAIVPVPLFFGFLHLLIWRDVPFGHFTGLHDWILTLVLTLSQATLPVIHGTGTVLVLSITAVVGGLLKYGSTILDTLLDVDNYLRISPRGETPRACIAERCTSLLRYIGGFRDEQGRPYDHLVIVAHSLGSLVAADLLRFLRDSNFPHENRMPSRDATLDVFGFHGDKPVIPVYLLTMGSPLRQLLDRFFPHLYGWVDERPDNSSHDSELGDALDRHPATISSTELPDPVELSVKGWCNAYRSGDYVGRFLWLGPWLARNDNPDSSGDAVCITEKLPQNTPGTAGEEVSTRDLTAGTRAEMCIGVGAHTHYWDRTAPDVARTLDALINDPAKIFSTPASS